jgi:hypothetical protein
MNEHDYDEDSGGDDGATTPEIIVGVDAINNPPGISLEAANTPGVDNEIPGVGEPVEISETTGVGETAGVHESPPSVNPESDSEQDSDLEQGLDP